MRIEFILTSAMEVSHFAPIVQALRALNHDALFAFPQTLISGETPYGFDDLDTILAAVKDLSPKVPCERVDLIRTDAGVTTFPATYINYHHAKTFRMQYGASVIGDISEHPMGKESDFYLVHGELGRRIQFEHHGLPSPMIPDNRVKVIGYPRLDGWWEHPPGDARIRANILWMPTWSVRSSIDQYIDVIDGMQSDRINVWVKPHHCTERWEPERMDKLSRFALINSSSCQEYVFEPADLILADLSSGAFAEALLVGKPVVGLSNPEEHKRALIDLCYLPTVTDPQYLSLVIEEALKDDWDDSHLDNIRDWLFTTTRGHDGELAARTILECLA